MKNLTGKIVIVALVLIFGGALWRQAEANAALREGQASLLARASELARLKNEQAEIKTTSLAEVELEKLQRASEQAARLRTQNEKLKAAHLRAVALADAPVWKNQGQAKPADTLQTAIWAAQTGEVEALAGMIAFDPESRAVADAMLASLPERARIEYPTTERLVATMMSGRISTDLSLAEEIEQHGDGPDRVSAKFRLQRSNVYQEPREVTLRFVRSGGNWQLLVPKSAIEGYAKSLRGR